MSRHSQASFQKKPSPPRLRRSLKTWGLSLALALSFSLGQEMGVPLHFWVSAQAQSAEQAQSHKNAADVLQVQETLIAAVRNPQLTATDYRQWLKQTQTQHEKILARSEKLRLELFPSPPISLTPEGHFLNNYKSERPLSPPERAQAYARETAEYQARPLGQPQRLDLSLWHKGPSEQGYDFVLTPAGEIFLSPIELRDGEISHEAGKWPNHTILAKGGPVQTAGNLFLFQQEGKRVLFLANKSGHYLPDYSSLQSMRQKLIQAGIPAEEIYLLSMGGYYANVVYKFFYAQQIDFQQPALRPRALHQQYLENWRKNWQSLDLKTVLNGLIEAPEKPLSPEQFKALKHMRKQALYLGSVYFLMDQRHTPPEAFETYVNDFGLLMDAVSAQQPATIYSRALTLQRQLNEQPLETVLQDFRPVSRSELQTDLKRRSAFIYQLLQPETLSVHDMHLIRIEFKHLLFLYMTRSQQQPASLLPELIRFHLQAITDHLGDLHDLAVQADLNGEAAYAEAKITLEPRLKKYLLATLERSLAQRF